MKGWFILIALITSANHQLMSRVILLRVLVLLKKKKVSYRSITLN